MGAQDSAQLGKALLREFTVNLDPSLFATAAVRLHRRTEIRSLDVRAFDCRGPRRFWLTVRAYEFAPVCPPFRRIVLYQRLGRRTAHKLFAAACDCRAVVYLSVSASMNQDFSHSHTSSA